MNILPILLGFAALTMFNKNGNGKQNNLTDMLSSPDTMGLISSISKLTNGNGDKSSAIMELLSNPQVAQVAKQLFNKSGEIKQEEYKQPTTTANSSSPQETKLDVERDIKFSKQSQELFKPVENIAGVKITQKLYNMYDNWYVKK